MVPTNAPQLLRTVCFQGLILTSWFNYYQAHNKLISTANVSVTDFDADRLDLYFSGSYPVKVSSPRDFEVQSRDMIRILSHAEIFSFAALKCLQSGNMDSRVFYGTLKIHVYDIHGLHVHGHCTDSRPTTDETRGGHRIGAKGSLTSEAKRKLRFAPCTSKLLLTGRLVPFTWRLGLSSTIPCLRGHY